MKRVEKLRYMHRIPVKRGLVLQPEQWVWSSYPYYADAERGVVLVNEQPKAEMKVRQIAWGALAEFVVPSFRNPR